MITSTVVVVADCERSIETGSSMSIGDRDLTLLSSIIIGPGVDSLVVDSLGITSFVWSVKVSVPGRFRVKVNLFRISWSFFSCSIRCSVAVASVSISTLGSSRAGLNVGVVEMGTSMLDLRLGSAFIGNEGRCGKDDGGSGRDVVTGLGSGRGGSPIC